MTWIDARTVVNQRRKLQELQQALEQEWGRIPQDRIRRMI